MTRIAVCQYAVEVLPHWDTYEKKIISLLTAAQQQQANILLLPEYAGTEIACGHFESDHALYAALQPLLPRYLAFYQMLAERYQMYIQPGTILVETTPGKYINRAYFFGPDKKYGYQDKLQLIEYEKNFQNILAGREQTLFDTAFGKIGIAICYDSEFPEHIRQLAYAGAWLILVPSYTTSLAGYHRVHFSCRARALENQCYVATSYVVGQVDVADPVETTIGQASIVGPMDVGFPADGIIAQGTRNEAGIITADIGLKELLAVRAHGNVHNFHDAKENLLLTGPALLQVHV